MSLEEFRPALYEQYQGEVFGEVALNRLLLTFQTPRQQYLLGTVLQFETETKARLRPTVAQLGLDIAELDESKGAGNDLADQVQGLEWSDCMQALCEIVTPVVSRFEEIADIAPDNFRALAESMIEHEKLIKQLFEQEARGEENHAVVKIGSLLRYPLASVQ